MKRRNKPSVYDQVDTVLDPFITAWGPPDPDDCVEAKKRILEVLDIIKDNSPSEPYCGFGPNFIYLPRLQQIYFLLQPQDMIFCFYSPFGHQFEVLFDLLDC